MKRSWTANVGNRDRVADGERVYTYFWGKHKIKKRNYILGAYFGGFYGKCKPIKNSVRTNCFSGQCS